ncbi:oxidoreductase [Candidatus Nitromaritima sp. SCGC AAA799-C22]|nr:oxidoreductase [Candidatus Nitromaritima sp. SCGC AAA799-C22]
MQTIRPKRSWELSERQVTPEDVYLKRREFLKSMGRVGLSTAALLMLPPVPGLSRLWAATDDPRDPSPALKPSPESIVSRYNNFYEFGSVKDRLWKLAESLNTEGWKIEVDGLVGKPQTLDVEKLIKKMPAEDRVYRLRCVEAWSVVIPWTGFPLRALVEQLDPLPSAKYVKFTTFLDPNIAPGQKNRFWEPWPYTEGLTLEEATNELSFMATGIYGHSLPPQHGAPIRLVVPWKYGFKSIKSIVRIEFTREEPETFWQLVSPLEYDFPANVIPHRPYARWHQEFEHIPGRKGTVNTELFNGYAKQVAHLYKM